MRDDDIDLALVRRAVKQHQPGWFHTFTAVLAGALLAGVLLVLGIRLWLHWSVTDTMRQIEEQRPARTR